MNTISENLQLLKDSIDDIRLAITDNGGTILGGLASYADAIRKLFPVKLYSIAYWDGSKVKTIDLTKWDSSLGTPIGVVVIPERILPDGKARIVSLNPVDREGNLSTSPNSVAWGGSGTDTSLTNYDGLPITDNNGLIIDPKGTGYLPSDKFTNNQSFVDAEAKYNSDTDFIPSPYLNNLTMNPDYCGVISGYNNALSDFNGLVNTQTLVELGSSYVAANIAWKYNDGVSSTQWYLPALGELGFLMARFNAINNVISSIGGVTINSGLWSSSEYNETRAYELYTDNGYIEYIHKNYGLYVRPFAIL